MKITKEKHETTYYQLNLSYDELNAIYHAVGNYTEMINLLISLHIGLFPTCGEERIIKMCNKISDQLKEIEPRLFYDLSFEDNIPLMEDVESELLPF